MTRSKAKYTQRQLAECSKQTTEMLHSVPLLTQYAGVGEPPGFTVGGVGRMAVGLTRVVCACCKKGRKKRSSSNTLTPR